jgi:type II secretion system protein N
MNDRVKLVLRGVGYLLFFVVVFFMSFSLTFPYERLKEKITASFNQQQQKTTAQQELQIEELSGYWFTGVHAKGVRVLSAPAAAGKPPVELRIDDARARLRLLPLLILNKKVGFKLELLEGKVDGTFTDTGSKREIDLDFEGVEVGKAGPVSQALNGLPLLGQLFGIVELELPEGKASKGNGKIALELRDVAIGDGKSKVELMPGVGLALDKMQIGTLTIEGEAKDGVIKFTKIKASGKDLEIDGEGTVRMKELANDSIVDIALKLKPSEGYKKKSEKTIGMFSLLDVSPDAKKAKGDGGWFGLKMTGPLGRLKVDPTNPNNFGGGKK